MYIQVIHLLFAWIVWELSQLTLNQAGSPTTDPDERYFPKGVDELRQELGSYMPSRVYRVFEQAVHFHRIKQYGKALKRYKKLRRIPYKQRTIDLYKLSSTFRHNWKILFKAIRDS